MVDVVAGKEGGRVKADVRRKLNKFEIAIMLWNFETALQTIKEFKDFPKNAYQLINSLATDFGNCGSQRTGYAYIGIPKTLNLIMEIASPWFDSKKGGEKPKAIVV
jgi:hypothetical protein